MLHLAHRLASCSTATMNPMNRTPAMNRTPHSATDARSRRRPLTSYRPERRTLRSRLALPLAVLAVPVGTALGGAVLSIGPPQVSPTAGQMVRIGCAEDPTAADGGGLALRPDCPAGLP